ncbi:MAG TPA: undecaprenyl-diphosphate phosphatase [Tepidisphaeraceae bacterium]|nr:undecaprenyl-diphosphate phosphatase [Tepidisphaeraceae bacterium]
MTYWQIILLSIIQGAAELLPVSSSAHVIAAAKLMGLDPSSPPFTLMLLMLHTGTMFAVIVYFWRAWKRAFFSSREVFEGFVQNILIATAITGVLGLALKFIIEGYMHHRHPGAQKAEIEQLFKHLELLAGALAAAGVLILYAGLASRHGPGRDNITTSDSIAIGAIQALCLPFRGFSRSGATISVGLLRGIGKARLEEYSFALAVVLTPPLVAWEALRLVRHRAKDAVPIGLHDFTPSLIGMGFSFIAGLIALKVLSKLLEKGQWWVFGVYCLFAAGGVFALYLKGY